MKKTTACRFCANAHTDPGLDSDNDLSYMGIGESGKGYRILFRSGDGRPTELLFEKWHEQSGWHSVGWYQPQYCPNCGRELTENKTLKSCRPDLQQKSAGK